MAGPTVNAPIILDLGKTKRKDVRDLRQGGGRLTGDVQDAVAQVTATLADQAEGKQIVPVVLVYQRKRRRRKNRGNGLFPVLF